jgi:hypothetical protein
MPSSSDAVAITARVSALDSSEQLTIGATVIRRADREDSE